MAALVYNKHNQENPKGHACPKKDRSYRSCPIKRGHNYLKPFKLRAKSLGKEESFRLVHKLDEEGARRASLQKAFHKWGVTTEKDHSHVATSLDLPQ